MLDQAWSTIATFVPKLVLFLVVLLIGWLIARALAKAADFLLRRVGFETAVERSGLGRALEDSEYDGTKLVSKVIFYLLMLVVLQFAFGIFVPTPISDVLNSLVAWLPRLLVAIAIVVVVGMIANAVRHILNSALSSVSGGPVIATGVWAFLLGLGVIAALNEMGIARFVTNSVLTAVLAVVAGVLIVGMGGGMIKPMQARWERWINRMEEESQRATVPRQGRRPADETPTSATAGTTGTGPRGTGASGPPPGTGTTRPPE